MTQASNRVRSAEEFLKEEKKGELGLAISGGGIRSATFALGVMQSLAGKGWLEKIDYLSTVSGGGYIGTWLSLLVQREKKGIQGAQEKLIPPPEMGRPAEEAGEINWLRRYSSYLAPVNGLFSPDTWLIFTIWIRNTILNLSVLIPFLAALLLGPWVYLQSLSWDMHSASGYEALGMLAGALGMLVASVVSYWMLKGRGIARGLVPALLVSVFSILLTLAAMMLESTQARIWLAYEAPRNLVEGILGITGMAIGLGCTFGMHTDQRRPKISMSFLCRGLICSLAPALYLMLLYQQTSSYLAENAGQVIVLILSGPIVAGACCFLLILIIGIMGPLTQDEDREGLSRVSAWIAILTAAGLVLNALTLYGPAVMAFLVRGGKILYATGGLWALISGAGAYFAQGSATSGKNAGTASLWQRLLPASAYVFVLGLLVLLSYGIHVGLANAGEVDNIWSWMRGGGGFTRIDGSAEWGQLWSGARSAMEADAESIARQWDPLLWLVAAAGLFTLFSRFVHVNEFSMFSFYRNRLVRAYCGASNREREKGDQYSRFTNLNPEDDLDLKDGKGLPFTHLINCAANISLEDTGLAERRAVSFVFTPFGCGYRMPRDGEQGARGYYRLYSGPGESPTFGTAMTISGAAASPNMGFHTSPALAFLMTVFNVRLGYWFWNPAQPAKVYQWLRERVERPQRVRAWLKKHSQWRPKGPKWGTFYFLSELFALADEKKKYLYLSDGGHFENLAVYELLARRLPCILCIDGEEDPKLRFESLGGLVRKAQQDFGVRIDIDTSDIEERSDGGWSRSHYTVGRIQYPGEERLTGYLVYIKLSVTGDEPQDVLTYRSMNPIFPHDSTADQFFGESQFESYRSLGHHVGEKVFSGWEDNQEELPKFFKKLFENRQPVPRALGDNFTKSNLSWDGFMKELQSSPSLSRLAEQLSGKRNDEDGSATAEERMFCLRLIQFMENVFFDLQLATTIDHPALSGWKQQFKEWFEAPLLKAVYEEKKSLFSKTFTEFCEREPKPWG
ncbi:MAG: patatin-like phospholipase family protein [Acidobacteriota bacterium]